MTRRARVLRAQMADAERVLWSSLRKDQLGWRFRRQHPIPPYVVDFACAEARLIIEADGGQHNERGEHDKRDDALRRQGWRIMRFWNNDILENRAGVLQAIVQALSTAEPPPKPSPVDTGEGE